MRVIRKLGSVLSRSMAQKDPKRILAVKIRQLGDTALFSSSIELLKKRFPTSELHVLVLRANKEVFLEHPAIHEIHTVKNASSVLLLKKMLILRPKNFDIFLGFHATQSLCRYAPLTGAPVRVLHHHSWKHTPWTATLDIEKPGELQNALLRDLEVLKPLGINEAPPAPKLYVSKTETLWAFQKLASLGFKEPKNLHAFLPAASIETKMYPQDLWKEAVKQTKSAGKPVLILSDPKHSKLWDLAGLCASLEVPLLDDLSLRELMAVLSLCDTAVGNDSGPIHLSAALGLKTLTLFGPACVGDWHPYTDSKNRKLRKSVDCRDLGPREDESFQYCTKESCDHLSCLRHIQPKEITQSLSL